MLGIMDKKSESLISGDFQFTTEDYILYILDNIPPAKATTMFVNKVAFLVEFAYKYKTFKDLSNAKYAAINYGPVIDDYDLILDKMHKEKKLERADNKKLIPIPSKSTPRNIPEKIQLLIDQLIEHYSHMTLGELVALTHQLDSYIITTKGEQDMGKIIDKDLAHLDMIFGDKDALSDEIDVTKLKPVDFNKLKEYEFKHI